MPSASPTIKSGIQPLNQTELAMGLVLANDKLQL